MIITGNEHVDCKAPFMEVRTEYINSKKQSIDVVLLGDSITEGFNIPYYIPTDKIIINSGMSGDRIMSLEPRLKRDVFDLKPKSVVLNIGINDLMHFEILKPELVEARINELSNQYKKICDQIINQNIELICTSIIKIAEQPYDETKQHFANYMFINHQINLLNNQIKEYCDSNQISYLDYNQQVCSHYNQLDQSFAYDGLHLNVKGYLEIIKILDAAGVL